MARQNPKHWAALRRFEPEAGQVIRRPAGSGRGYWAGAPGVAFDEQQQAFYLTYRLRRPRGERPDRGYEVQIARSSDGLQFETIWTGCKDQLQSASIERCALQRGPAGDWLLYVSYVDPADGRWRTDWLRADQPDKFDLASGQPALTAVEIGVEGVKDPFVFQLAGMYHMVLSFAHSVQEASHDQLHGSADAYNTGLIRSATGLATSRDGVHWRWEGEVFGPGAAGWDRYCARIGSLWREDGVWLAIYDGSADVSENYEERAGIAYSFDLRRFQRATPDGPWLTAPQRAGAMRYFDVLAFPDATFFYYEMAQADGSHDLRVYRQQR